jgi:hypothetical protein
MKLHLTRFITLLLCLLPFHLQAENSDIEVKNGWINNLPPSIPMRAGYMLLENGGNKPMRITRIESNAFATVEIHETRSEQGVMKMVEIGAIEIPADGTAELKPGGMHLMLIKPQTNLSPGSEIPLTLFFDDGSSLDTQLKVSE